MAAVGKQTYAKMITIYACMCVYIYNVYIRIYVYIYINVCNIYIYIYTNMLCKCIQCVYMYTIIYMFHR